MTPERWERVKELFDAALNQDPDARGRFLAEACPGDESLCAEVAQLLAQHQPTHDFLEKPVVRIRDWEPFSEGSTFHPEQVVHERFRVVRYLEHDRLGEVYEAVDLERHYNITLRVLRQDLARNNLVIEALQRDIERLRHVHHLNVSRVYDLLRDGSGDNAVVWLVTMELIRGVSLSDRLTRHGPMSSTEAWPFVCQMCEALDVAHRAGVVHADFKPTNVMLVTSANESPRLIVKDFAFARLTMQADAAKGVTVADALAPEQLEGEAATAQSDIYALGMVMYEMVTGTRPFLGLSGIAAAVKRLTEPPVPPRAHVLTLDLRWEETILRCLERDPARRFATAADVRLALSDSPPRCENLSMASVGASDESLPSERSVATDHPFGINSRFQVRQYLGAGGFGTVYQAFDHRSKQELALKVLHRLDPEALYRFKREFRSLMELRHPNLIRLYELMAENDRWYFTMELIVGQSFLEYVRPHGGPCDFTRLRYALAQLLSAVDAVHSAKYLHRDLKPANVLVTTEGRVEVLDFGVVHALAPIGHDTTATNVGTPAYMAPEQLGFGRLAPSSDGYAIGAMLFEALTGEPPRGRSLVDVLGNISRIVDPLYLDPNLPRDLAGVCSELLHVEAAARPSLQAALNRIEAAPDLNRMTAPSISDHRHGQVFVGRRSALERLATAWSRCRKGRFQLVTVTGQAGMGKTALVDRFISDAHEEDRDLLILSGRCREHESVPYMGVDAMVDALSQYLCQCPDSVVERLLPRNAFLLPLSFPVLGRVKAIAAAPASLTLMPDPHEVRQLTFSVFRELLARLADRVPLLLWVDDLQWADRDALALLTSLNDTIAPPRIMLIVSFRDDDRASTVDSEQVHALAEQSSRLSDSMRVPLSGLALDECAELLASSGLTDGTAAAIAGEAGGHPLYLLELIQAVRIRKELGMPAAEPHQSLDDIVQERVRSLTCVERELVELVAIAVQPLPAAVFMDAISCPGHAWDVIESAITNRFIRVTPGPLRRLDMFHDLVRTAVIRQMDAETRRRHHAELAAVLRRDPNFDPPTLVTHYREAGDLSAAHHAAVEAAQQAERQLAFDSASALYAAAIDTDPGHGTISRSILLRRHGDVLSKAGRGNEAASAYLAAAAYSDIPAVTADLKRAAADQYMRSGSVDAALRLLTEMLEAAGISVPRPSWATNARILISQFVTEATLILRGIPSPRHKGHVSRAQNARLELLRTGGVVLSLADPQLSTYFQVRYVREAMRARDPIHLSTALAIDAIIRATMSSRTSTRISRLLDESERIARRTRDSVSIGFNSLARAYVAYLLGQTSQGIRDSTQALDEFRSHCTGVAWEMTAGYVLLLWCKCWSGEFKDATVLASELLRQAAARGDVNLEVSVTLLANVHVAWLADDTPHQSIAACTRALDRAASWSFHRQHFGAMFALAESRLYMNDIEGAQHEMTSVWDRMASSHLTRWRVVWAMALFLRGRVFLARWLGDPDARDSAAQVARCVTALKRLDFSWAVPMSDVLESGLRLGHGDVLGALLLLDESRIGFESTHLFGFAQAASYLHGLLADGESRRESDGARRALQSRGVRDPERFVRMVLGIAPSIVERERAHHPLSSFS